MPMSTQMQNCTTNLMPIRMSMKSVVRLASQTTKHKACACEVSTNANVEGHIAGVVVYVQMCVLVLFVPHYESVMSIKLRSLFREENCNQVLQHTFLQRKYHVFHADLVHDHTVVVHGVRTSRRQLRGIEALKLLNKHRAESLCKHRKTVDTLSLLIHELPYQSTSFCWRHCTIAKLPQRLQKD